MSGGSKAPSRQPGVDQHLRGLDAVGLNRDIRHAGAEDVPAVENDVTDIDADAELDTFFRRQIRPCRAGR